MKYKIGDEIVAVVTGIEKYGIFVRVAGGYTGLIHISEITDKFVKNTYSYAGLDDEIKVKILDIDNEKKHLSLSIKRQIDPDNYILKRKKIIETRNGFNPLKEHLDRWIDEKLDEINKEK